MANDTIGLVYDDDAAVRCMVTIAGVDEDAARAILRAKDEFLLGLGILPADAIDGMTPEQARAVAPSYFYPEHMAARLVSPVLEASYVVMRTGLPVAVVDAAMLANTEYMRRVGIMH